MKSHCKELRSHAVLPLVDSTFQGRKRGEIHWTECVENGLLAAQRFVPDLCAALQDRYQPTVRFRHCLLLPDAERGGLTRPFFSFPHISKSAPDLGDLSTHELDYQHLSRWLALATMRSEVSADSVHDEQPTWQYIVSIRYIHVGNEDDTPEPIQDACQCWRAS